MASKQKSNILAVIPAFLAQKTDFKTFLTVKTLIFREKLRFRPKIMHFDGQDPYICWKLAGNSIITEISRIFQVEIPIFRDFYNYFRHFFQFFLTKPVFSHINYANSSIICLLQQTCCNSCWSGWKAIVICLHIAQEAIWNFKIKDF